MLYSDVVNVRVGTSYVLHVIRDHLDATLVLSGFMLLVVGLLYKRDMGSWFSAGTLFLGIVSFTFGFFLKLGIFSVKLRSLAGVGITLICASVICLALSIALFQFIDMTILRIMRVRHGDYYRITCILWEQRYLWLCNPLAQVSLGLLISGVTARFFSFVLPPINSKIISNKRPSGDYDSTEFSSIPKSY